MPAASPLSSFEEVTLHLIEAGNPDTGTLLDMTKWVIDKLTPERLRKWVAEVPSLLRLPRELCDQILTEVFVHGHTIEVIPATYRNYEEGNTDDTAYTLYNQWSVIGRGYSPPALLQTCLQLREEGAEIFYGQNEFLGYERVVDTWQGSLPSEHADIVRPRCHTDDERKLCSPLLAPAKECDRCERVQEWHL